MGNVVLFPLRAPRKTWFDTSSAQDAAKMLAEFPLLVTELPDTFFEVVEPWSDEHGEKWIPGDVGVVCNVLYDTNVWWVNIEHQDRGCATQWSMSLVQDLIRRTVPTQEP
jgi:hypothetical protein